MDAEYYNETIAGGRCSFWTSDKAMEPKNERIYLWGKKWDLHHQPAKDCSIIQRGL
jgi:hypothetical protein